MRGNLSYSPLHYSMVRIHKVCAIAQTWNTKMHSTLNLSIFPCSMVVFFSYCGKFSGGKYSALYYTLTMLQMRNCRRCYHTTTYIHVIPDAVTSTNRRLHNRLLLRLMWVGCWVGLFISQIIRTQST